MSDQKIRFTSAIQAIRARGVRVIQNATEKQNLANFGMTPEERDVQPLAWTDGRQGGTYTWRDDRPAYVTRKGRQDHVEPAAHILFNHANGAAQIMVEEFRARGFDVTWDGTEFRTVMVNFPEVKPYRVWRS